VKFSRKLIVKWKRQAQRLDLDLEKTFSADNLSNSNKVGRKEELRRFITGTVRKVGGATLTGLGKIN